MKYAFDCDAEAAAFPAERYAVFMRVRVRGASRSEASRREALYGDRQTL